MVIRFHTLYLNKVGILRLKLWMVHCLIIDNDKSVVSFIKSVGNDFSEIFFDGIDENQEHCLNHILEKTPEVILFNIDSSAINIPEFVLEVRQFSLTTPVFCAISFSKEKAFEAYKYQFLDFLLKPLTELAIRKTLLRVQKKIVMKRKQTVCIKSYKDYQYLKADDILFLKADNNTTDFIMRDGSAINAFKTLKTFEEILPKNFLRIHRSYIVNSDYVSRIQYGKCLCTIAPNNLKIPFTKTFLENVGYINEGLFNSAVISLN